MFPTQYTWTPQGKTAVRTMKAKDTTQDRAPPQFARYRQDTATPQQPEEQHPAMVNPAPPKMDKHEQAIFSLAKPQGIHPAFKQPQIHLNDLGTFVPEKPRGFHPAFKPNIPPKDFSKFVQTHDQLKQLGCLFSEEGELIGYGHPESRTDFDKMLRMGPIYDEQWTVFFSEQTCAHSEYSLSTVSSKDGTALWADLRTLKKVLAKEGVEFDSCHNRFRHRDENPALLRLCKVYDDRLKLWSSSVMTMTARTSPRALIRLLALEAEQNAEMDSPIEDHGFLDDDDSKDDSKEGDEMLGSSESASIKSVSIERPSFGHPFAVRRGSGTPRNIGWRFSDDFEDRRTSLDAYFLDETLESSDSQTSSSLEQRTESRSSFETMERGGPSSDPLSAIVDTDHADTIQADELIEEQQEVIPCEMDHNAESVSSTASENDPNGESKAKPPQKKGLRRWVRNLRYGAYTMVY